VVCCEAVSSVSHFLITNSYIVKYNININQKELANTGLDIKDSVILDYLYFYCNSNSEKISYHRLEGGWTWVDYNSIIKDMPLLRTKSLSVISKRISKLVKEGFIETHRPDHMKTYIKLTDKVDTLFVNTNSPIRKKEQGLGGTYSFLRTNNNTIDNNTKDNRELFNQFWEAYPNKKGKVVARKAFEKLNTDKSLLQAILKGIERYKKTRQWMKDNGDYIPNPSTFLNQRRWEDEVKVERRSYSITSN